MSFLKKLRDRMFRSSDKIGEGLDELVGAESPAPGIVGRLLGGDEPRRLVDDALLQGLEDLLITSDMGVDTAVRVTANIAEGRFGKKVSTAEIKQALADEIARIMGPVARPLPGNSLNAETLPRPGSVPGSVARGTETVTTTLSSDVSTT